MSAIALIGCLTFFIPEVVWRKMILPLVAFAAGALIGGAIFHMIPAAVEQMGNGTALYCWLAGGYMLFYALEEFLHWHHSHTHAHYDHHHHEECSHHHHELENHGEIGFLICSHHCYIRRGLPSPVSKKACTPSDERAAEKHGLDTNMNESTSKRTVKSQDEPLLHQMEGDKQRSDAFCGYASSLHGTLNCKRDANPVLNCNHRDLEGKVENRENHLQNLNTQSDEENIIEHSITTQIVQQNICEVSNNINEQNQRHASEQLSSNHEIQDTSTEMTSVIAYLIIIADALHNFLGGLFVGASFVDSTSLGISAWIAAAAHEIPQELGDFAILRHGGWSSQKALFFNFLSALTFPLGGAIAFTASKHIEVSFLIPFAAGNFLYIGGSDLIPEVKHSRGTKQNFIHFVSCLVGVALMLLIRILI